MVRFASDRARIPHGSKRREGSVPDGHKSNRPAPARADQEMSDGAILRGRLTYSATASAKIALPCCVCKYQSVKRKT